MLPIHFHTDFGNFSLLHRIECGLLTMALTFLSLIKLLLLLVLLVVFLYSSQLHKHPALLSTQPMDYFVGVERSFIIIMSM